MSRSILLAGAAMLGLATWPAFAQTPADTETRDLIERLRPTEQQTRGIRMPGTDSGTATPAPDATPTLTPAPTLIPAVPAPSVTADPAPGAAPAMPPPTAFTPVAPPPPPSVARDTTAPAGMAAVSITVNFASGSYALSPQAAASLNSLGRALASPDLRPFRFRIEGHTDSVGDAGLNMALSQRRAEAVRDFLLKSFPVAPSRLVAIGLGETQLLVPSGDNMDEPRNRRVQIVNLGG